MRDKIKSIYFVQKLVVLAVVSGLALYSICSATDTLWVVVGQVVLGVMFAHALELLHECLHGTALSKPRANELVGLFLGLPMLVSFTHYRWAHLRHHKTLGLPDDQGFFQYEATKRFSVIALIRSAFNMERYINVFKNIRLAFTSQEFDEIPNHVRAKIAFEYRLIAVLVLAGAVCLTFGYTFPITIWAVPLLLVAEPVHFLIELPEHLLCDTNSQDIAKNSRSITGTRFSRWLTNGNNFHVEHHACPSLPFRKLAKLHERKKSALAHISPTYPQFYFQVLRRLAPSYSPRYEGGAK